MLDWLPLGLPINTPLHPTYREDELKVAFIVGSLGPFPRHELVLKYSLHLRMLYQEHLQHGQWKNPFWVIEVVQDESKLKQVKSSQGVRVIGTSSCIRLV